MSHLPKTIRVVGEKAFRWYHATKSTDRELQFLEEEFGFDPLDLHDCLPSLQRPKLIVRDSYLFLILNLPSFDKQQERLVSNEIDIFITKRGVVTVSTEMFPALENFFELLDTNEVYQRNLLQSPGIFFEQLLDEVLDDAFPQLMQISNDIERLNTELLHGSTRQSLLDIMRLKNNLIVFQKAMQPNRDLFTRIEPLMSSYLCINAKQCPTFNRLISHTVEIWDNLAMYNEAADAISNMHINLTSLKLNDTLQTIFVFSLWIGVLATIAGFFGMGLAGTPFAGNPMAFWVVVSIATLASGLLLLVFKRRRWL